MSDTERTNEEQERLTVWVRRHGAAILGFLTGMVRDRALAEDLMQEVFCRAWQARGRYRDTGRERAYLLRIADRLACDHVRRRKREGPLEATGAQPVERAGREDAPWQRMAQVENERLLAAALGALSEPQRRTLLLRYYGNLGFHEIAEQLGIPLNTVLSHNRRGLSALRPRKTRVSNGRPIQPTQRSNGEMPRRPIVRDEPSGKQAGRRDAAMSRGSKASGVANRRIAIEVDRSRRAFGGAVPETERRCRGCQGQARCQGCPARCQGCPADACPA
ncbi:MAG TPA: sigma-70 family RNA polymerase sigma factor [Pirellulales bacterium]|nr:sigma-70 family RNA polymerase sigma factor [Pirellulales bacterium]